MAGTPWREPVRPRTAYACTVPGKPDPADPYLTLGLEPGASVAEIKRAYRLLAKAFHPDSAGDAATPRFLAIQDAYEQLKSGRAPSAARTSRAPQPPPAEAWRADPARARVARERARAARGAAGRAGTGRADGAGPRTRSGSTGDPGPGGPASAGAAGGRRSTGTASSGGRGSGRRRDVRKATMGSTSYDEARDEVRDPTDATWSGASWYGPSSGEYWIINPREYADPRKHGPEYQQRARRPLDGETSAASDAAAEVAGGAWQSSGARGESGSGPSAAGPSAAGAAAARATTGAGPAAARATAGGASAPRATAASSRPRAAWAAPGPDAFGYADDSRWRRGESTLGADGVEALGAASRAWLGGPADDPVRRLGLALVAWPPIGLAAAAVIGELTGCTVYSANCGGSEPLLPWLAQAAILGLLLLLPPIARLLAGGAIAVLVALVPITAFLLAVGGSGAPQAAPVMAALLAAAWLVGIGWSTRVFRGRRAAGAAQ